MQDIVPKSRSEAFQSPKAGEKYGAWQQRIHKANVALGHLVSFFTDEESSGFVVRTPKSKQLRKKTPRASLTFSNPLPGVKARVVGKARRAKRHLNTPIGKVALLNSIALFALFTFVVQKQLPSTSTQELERNTAEVAKSTLRQYQPTIGYIPAALEPFSETTTTQTKNLPLYTWVTPWNTESIKANLASYKNLSAFWLTVEADGSTISPKANWQDWDSLQSLKTPQQSTSVTVTGDPDATFITISSTSAQQVFITNISNLLKEKNIEAVDINFEALGSENRELFTAFIRNLNARLKPEGKKVFVTLEARLGNAVPMDWRNLGLIADEVRIMAYDYHARNTGNPGPIAPLGWVKEVVDYATTQIDPSKIVVGLGNYGYNWLAPEAEATTWQGVGLSFERATTLAAELDTPILRATGIDDRGYDIGTIPYFSYTEKETGRLRAVWFEDATSLGEKVSLLSQYPLRGVIFWSVGIGDASFWRSMQQSTSKP
jgi:spore germination protein YaaH